MAPDPKRLEVDIRQFVAAAKGKMAEAVLEAVQDVAEQVVVRSPFKTGFLMSAWFMTIGAPAKAEPRKKPKDFAGGDRSGAATLGAINMALLDYSLGETVYLQNAAVYARRLEYGFVGEDSLGRTYAQEPRAWVRGVLSEWPSIAMEAAKRVAAGQGGGANPGGGGRLPDKGYVKP